MDGKEIERRITQAKQVIGSLNSVFWSGEITKGRKMRVYEAMVRSSLLYGSETWRLTERFKSRLEVVEMDVLTRSSRTSRREHVPIEVIKRERQEKTTCLVWARETHGRLQAT
ncbi:hypothetical protein HHI36_006105 [Cryptolaemus montrouzieri]|uniref:Uncharacterized protein n=1 Tax=Cryptolaemus montrouzieri TaxID=559131 RepID=A0ABD2NWJ8_9CUCU